MAVLALIVLAVIGCICLPLAGPLLPGLNQARSLLVRKCQVSIDEARKRYGVGQGLMIEYSNGQWLYCEYEHDCCNGAGYNCMVGLS